MSFPRFASSALLFLAVLLPLFNVNAEEGTFKVGVVYGFSGTANVWADYGRKGLELAEEEINSAGGINGQQLELVYEDSKSSAAGGVSALRNLLAAKQVSVVLGDVWSFLTEPLIPVVAAENATLISPTVMDLAPASHSPAFFTMGYRMESLRAPIEQFFKLNPDIRTAAIFCFQDSWNQAHVKLWSEIAKSHGVKIVDVLEQTDFNHNFREEVTKAAIRKPDAFIVAYGIDRIVSRMKERNFSAKILTTSDMIEALKVRKMPAELAKDIYFTDWRPNKDFVGRFKARFAEEPILEAHNHYEALRSVAKAAAKGGDNFRENLRDVAYDGVAGRIDFSTQPFVNFGEAQLHRVRKDGSVESLAER